MILKINGCNVDVPVSKDILIKELIKETEECCKCRFDDDVLLYDKLLRLIKARKKEPICYSCIE